MFEITAWENGVGYNVEVDRIFAETLAKALNEALKSKDNKGNAINAIGNIFGINVTIEDKNYV
jgi:hypothetical protein